MEENLIDNINKLEIENSSLISSLNDSISISDSSSLPLDSTSSSQPVKLSRKQKRLLFKPSKEWVSKVKEEDKIVEDEIILDNEILIITAYTEDYTIGYICDEINRRYAKKYGYQFLSVVDSCMKMLERIKPKIHFTWYKIYLLMKLFEIITGEKFESLNNKIENSEDNNDSISSSSYYSLENPSNIKYILWIDADAMVVKNETKLQEKIKEAKYKSLIIAEDMHPHCLINAGVFILKVNNWSKDLLNDVWKVEKYNEVFYYEQSALLKILKSRKEGMFWQVPSHSYLPGGVLKVKIYQNSSVFPDVLFSSNKGIDSEDIKLVEEKKSLRWKKVNNEERENEHEEMEEVELDNVDEKLQHMFIYHAAGLEDKIKNIRAALVKFKLDHPFDSSLFSKVFHLDRNTLGHMR